MAASFQGHHARQADLNCWFDASNRVSVSPSATATTRPCSVSASDNEAKDTDDYGEDFDG